MKKFLIFTGVAITIILILGGITLFFVRKQTKSFSPEENIKFTQNGLVIDVFYNRPYKRGRLIFGGLVPFDKIWRTGANEATSFETNKDLKFGAKILKAGKYSLWTIPRQENWTVIFNSEYGQWGINFNGDVNKDSLNDVLSVDALAVQQNKEFEQFTIFFERTEEEAEMVLVWDKTLVAVPFSYQ